MFISKRKSEPAHYMLKIESFSLLSDSESKSIKVESDVFEASDHKWKLDLYPNGNEEENKGNISLYIVVSDTDSRLEGWEIYVDVNFFVYDHLRNNYVSFQDSNGNRTRFHEKKKIWGFDKLMSLESFNGTENGYIFNNSCVFGVEVFAAPLFTLKDRCLSMIKPQETTNKHTWTINKFSELTDDVLVSEAFKIGKVKWEISLYPKGYDEEGKELSIFLRVHEATSLPDGWRVFARYKLRLKNRIANVVTEEEYDYWFNDTCTGYGSLSFLCLTELRDLTNGFLLNDKLVVEAEILVVGTLKNFI